MGDNLQQPLPLVLLPGTLCDATLFAPMLELLLSSRSVIIPEMGCRNSAEALASDLLDALPPRFALVGFSLGGIVAIEMAAVGRERVAGLALISTTARPVPLEERATRRARASAARSPAEHAAQNWPASVAARHSGNTELGDTIVGMAARCTISAFLNQTDLALTRPDNRLRLPSLRMPVLVIAGSEDSINPPDIQREMANVLPDVTLTLVAGAGHFLPLEAPRVTAAALAAWLRRVETAHRTETARDAALPNQRQAAGSRP